MHALCLLVKIIMVNHLYRGLGLIIRVIRVIRIIRVVVNRSMTLCMLITRPCEAKASIEF